MKSDILFKRFFLIAFTILFTGFVSSQSKTNIIPKFGVDVAGKHSVSALGQSGDLNVNSGISFSMDLLASVSNNLDIGLGVLYQFPREQELEGSGNFNFVPVYGALKIKVGNNMQSVIPCIVGNVGYCVLFNGEDKYKGSLSLHGGLYFGAGIQVEISKFVIEGMFKSFNGTAELDNSSFQMSGAEFEINYTTLSVMIGVVL